LCVSTCRKSPLLEAAKLSRIPAHEPLRLGGRGLSPQKLGSATQTDVSEAVKGATLTADQITDLLAKGNDAKKAPHKKAIAGVSADDAKAVADYVKTLK
jgi:hypothetical protein